MCCSIRSQDINLGSSHHYSAPLAGSCSSDTRMCRVPTLSCPARFAIRRARRSTSTTSCPSGGSDRQRSSIRRSLGTAAACRKAGSLMAVDPPQPLHAVRPLGSARSPARRTGERRAHTVRPQPSPLPSHGSPRRARQRSMEERARTRPDPTDAAPATRIPAAAGPPQLHLPRPHPAQRQHARALPAPRQLLQALSHGASERTVV